MRKSLLVMATLLLVSPAFAATVTLSVDDIGGGKAAIRYSADANVSGFGLKIYTTSDVNITDINDYNVGECTATQKGYGIFPGTIDINEDTGVVDDNGTPVAPNDAPGASGTGLDTNTIIVEMGALYVEGNEPALSGTLLTVTVAGNCTLCVEGESIRGNVVFTDACSVEPAVACNDVIVSEDCFPDWYSTYADWVTLNKPDCWCGANSVDGPGRWKYQCDGDAAGETYGYQKYRVYNPDLTAVINNWKKKIDDPNLDPCADIDHKPYGYQKYRVYNPELTTIINNWKKKDSDLPGDCPRPE